MPRAAKWDTDKEIIDQPDIVAVGQIDQWLHKNSYKPGNGPGRILYQTNVDAPRDEETRSWI